MTLRLLLTLASLLLLMPLHAGSFDSGDEQLDRWLINIDFVSRDNPEKYLEAMAKRNKLSFEKIMVLNLDYEFTPADICTLIGLSKATKQNQKKLLEIFLNYRNQGLEALFSKVGLKPKSEPYSKFRSFIQKQAPKRDLEADSRNIFIKKKSD